MRAMRPDVMSLRHVVVSGHTLTAQAGFQILEAGGNAIDAGGAVGIATPVNFGSFRRPPLFLRRSKNGNMAIPPGGRANRPGGGGRGFT